MTTKAAPNKPSLSFKERNDQKTKKPHRTLKFDLTHNTLLGRHATQRYAIPIAAARRLAFVARAMIVAKKRMEFGRLVSDLLTK